MSDSTTRYRPRDYRRTCDVCGNLRNISEMHLQDTLWVCTYDAGERVRTQLDRGNARQRPFTIKPVPHPKPWDNYYPNTLETDDAAVFNFLDRQIQAKARFELITSGSSPVVSTTTAGGVLLGMGWAGRYLYDLIQANDRAPSMLDRARVLLRQLADFLLTKQEGSPTGEHPTFTRDQNAFYGAIRFQGTNTQTPDAAAGGLALLYAYRLFGDAKYITGARAAASYLRNVQAVGRYATNFPSTDPFGVNRLYTGSVSARMISNNNNNPATIIQQFWSFQPGMGLLTLEFWNELKITDGDQSIGATSTTASGTFISAPAQLLSQSITDIRNCWDVGIVDATGTLINGLSTTTPREVFDAYPLGTGMWIFADADASTGTQVSSQNFAQAISSLYNYEGASSTVTTLSDWLRSFTSNPAFETPANTSVSVLYQGTTGTYDPTTTIATMLQVRDPTTFASTTINGSSQYDWGAFGLLSRLWASRHKASFRASRLMPLGVFQRFYNGNWNDGLNMDRITLMGISGLSLQTNISPLQNDAVLSAQFGRTFRESRS